MEEIILKIFGSPDLTVFLLDLVGAGDSVYSCENLLEIFGEFRENVFDMYGDSRENSFEILAVVIISSPISSVGAEHGKKREGKRLLTVCCGVL